MSELHSEDRYQLRKAQIKGDARGRLAIGRARLSRCDAEPPIVSWQEVPEHPVGLLNGSCAGEAHLRDQAVLEGVPRPLHSTLGLDADRRRLEAQKAQQEMDRLVLEMEHKYGLISDGRTIDPRTATIQGTAQIRKGNGKEPQEALETATVEVAAA